MVEHIAVIGPRGSGKTSTAVALANMMAERGKLVALIPEGSREVAKALRRYANHGVHVIAKGEVPKTMVDVYVCDGFIPLKATKLITLADLKALPNPEVYPDGQ